MFGNCLLADGLAATNRLVTRHLGDLKLVAGHEYGDRLPLRLARVVDECFGDDVSVDSAGFAPQSIRGVVVVMHVSNPSTLATSSHYRPPFGPRGSMVSGRQVRTVCPFGPTTPTLPSPEGSACVPGPITAFSTAPARIRSRALSHSILVPALSGVQRPPVAG